MTRIEPLPREALPAMEESFKMIEAVMGFVPTSFRTMAHVPGLAEAFQVMGAAVLGNQLLDPQLRSMIAHVVSNAAGCRYCQAHTAATAHHQGADIDKIAALWSFETSELFTSAERAALTLAFHAGQVPNASTDADFDECRKHFSSEQIAAIVAVISLFGFLNRWNDTMATTLEKEPMTLASDVLTANGWTPGKHAAS